MQENLKVELIEKELLDIDLIEKELISINLVEKITTPIDVDLVEKELVEVNIVDKELIEVILNNIDVIHREVTNLSELGDININNLINNHFIVYNSSTKKWINLQVLEYDETTDEFKVNLL